MKRKIEILIGGTLLAAAFIIFLQILRCIL